jgi:hypothetical protein
MRHPEDERAEDFYKSMNEGYFGRHMDRYRHPRPPSHFDYPHHPPHPPPPSSSQSHLARANSPAMFLPRSSSADDEVFEARHTKDQSKNPFECSNAELIKKMICCWVPEEDMRKNSVKDTIDLSPLDIIVQNVDQILYSLVDWAKSTIFFRDMSTEDQMSLLHETWGEMVILDHVYRQVWFSDSHSILLVNGRSMAFKDIPNKFDGTGVKLFNRLCELSDRFRQIQIDRTELVCLKFLILFNAKDSKAQNVHYMTRVSERINACLLEYVHDNYPEQSDRFLQLLMRLPDVRGLSLQIENWLNEKYVGGMIANNTLLAEMLNMRFHKN